MVDQIRVKSGVLLGALVSGALAAGTLTAAPTANATCASFWGIGNSADCTSKLFSVAIAIGGNAQAHADGLFGAAFSTGFDAEADAGGVFGIAAQLGQYGTASTGGPALNIAVGVSPGTPALLGTLVQANGVGNIAVNLFGTGDVKFGHRVVAYGYGNVAANLGGSDEHVYAGQGTGALNVAFNTLGYGNDVEAGPGPLAIAGSIGQTNATVVKKGPGFNINGIRVPNTAAAGGGTKTSAPTVAATSHRASAATANVGHKK